MSIFETKFDIGFSTAAVIGHWLKRVDVHLRQVRRVSNGISKRYVVYWDIGEIS